MSANEESEDEELEFTPPETERILRRAFCLSAVVYRSLIDVNTDDERYRESADQIVPWLTEIGADTQLEPWESKLLHQPFGQIEKQTRINGTWLSEGLVVLVWSMGLFELPPHDENVDPFALLNALHFMQPDAADLLDMIKFVPEAEIEKAAQRALAVHWRLREFSLFPRSIDFAHHARTAWCGPLNIEGIVLAESDLSIGGGPIAKAPPNAVYELMGRSRERHQAFNWLLGHDEIYSEVDAST